MNKQMERMTLISKSLGTVMEYSTGLMAHITKASGTSTKLKDKEFSGMQKEMFTRATSEMIWLMDMESILTSTAAGIKENSKMMYKKAMVRRSGLMELSMLVLIKME